MKFFLVSIKYVVYCLCIVGILLSLLILEDVVLIIFLLINLYNSNFFSKVYVFIIIIGVEI